MSELPTPNERLEAVGEFMDHTSYLTAYQLETAKFLEKVSTRPKLGQMTLDVMRQNIQATIKANVELVGDELQALVPSGYKMYVTHPDDGRQAMVGGIDYSEESRTYTAVTGINSAEEPITWPLENISQLAILPANPLQPAAKKSPATNKVATIVERCMSPVVTPWPKP